MIRVLQVFHGMDCGGAENMIMNLYRHVDRTKVQFDFLVHTTKKCFFDDEIKELGGRIFSVPYYKIVNGLQYKSALDNFFRNHPEIKIVHGHLGSCAHIYLNIAKNNGCYTIAHSHNTKPQMQSLKNFLYRLFTYKTRRTADYFFGCSVAAAEYRFGKKIAHSDRCSVLKNAIDLETFAYSDENRKKLRKEFGLTDEFVVGHIGRFNPQKNHSFLIDVFAEIHRLDSKTVLFLLGDGYLRSSIEYKVKEFGLQDNVFFTGVRSDANRFLSVFDIFLFPSLYEGLPVTLIEAQANGLPIVCSDSITKEVILTNNIEMISLKQNPKYWANSVIKKRDASRIKKKDMDVIAADYDILKTSFWLMDFYEKKII
ncbi:glycosyltransferase family 1 protein [uncultured Fibrobacter sp.]|uniref:glycosyltransferase family 1 protein n=1 Tax=uncultured Fibrobacter sp. TaxID=261512 RepID=UPI0025F05A88|nr:glycosyltransferase family 1 protein [uncultured Fibrobacter sp.]